MTEIAPNQEKPQAVVKETDVSEDERLRTDIETQSALVGPILSELYKHAAEETDLWLKKSSLRILADFILSTQNLATLFQQQLEAAGEVIAAQSDELEQLRPVKRAIWTPFNN